MWMWSCWVHHLRQLLQHQWCWVRGSGRRRALAVAGTDAEGELDELCSHEAMRGLSSWHMNTRELSRRQCEAGASRSCSAASIHYRVHQGGRGPSDSCAPKEWHPATKEDHFWAVESFTGRWMQVAASGAGGGTKLLAV